MLEPPLTCLQYTMDMLHVHVGHDMPLFYFMLLKDIYHILHVHNLLLNMYQCIIVHKLLEE